MPPAAFARKRPPTDAASIPRQNRLPACQPFTAGRRPSPADQRSHAPARRLRSLLVKPQMPCYNYFDYQNMCGFLHILNHPRLPPNPPPADPATADHGLAATPDRQNGRVCGQNAWPGLIRHNHRHPYGMTPVPDRHEPTHHRQSQRFSTRRFQHADCQGHPVF